MKRRNWIVGTLAAGTVSALLLAGAAQAFPPCGGFHPLGPIGGGERIVHLLERLDLSPAQRDQVWAILDAERDNRRTQRTAMIDGRKEIHALVTADDYDPAQLRALADAQGDAVTEMIVQHAELMRQVRGVLTPEQLGQLDRLREMRFERLGR